ncbi:hypothetical protein MUS1_08180 [Marinomonas ushuaiensis DSM 15871]|uniref:Uncharacterized protein n=1 Tax=Marinomonas ushuaiensis DSM 15871 TaxID=1122207 RepID=X7E9T5_9GAMM|nr:hypothetical protein [Marinomonas ushuaiensis]ETX11941.1 hypothetical protein MUS1_08180 [Marinomonas ushuaiensis DSM 15871]
MNIFITYGSAVILVLLGTFLSYIEFLNDTDWLARCGSMIVVMGILYTILEFYEHQYDHITLKRQAPNLYADIKHEHKHLEEKKVKIWKKNAEELEDEIKNGLEKKTMKHEGILLMTGTFIWGFGDLPFKLIF